MSDFNTVEDIANRALQHCKRQRIKTITDHNENAQEVGFVYAKLRQSELRRRVWAFSVRRVVLRSTTATTQTVVTPPTWAVGTTYTLGAVVQDSAGVWWISSAASNLAHTPGPGIYWMDYYGSRTLDAWSGVVQYFPGDLITSGGVVYTCVAPSLNNAVPNATYWAAWAAGSALGAVVPFDLAGYNTATLSDVRNRFVLPYNYLRLAPQDAKQPNTPRLAVSAEVRYRDWEIENNGLFTGDTSPLGFRFVADSRSVALMDPLFCEALAARIAMELYDRFGPPGPDRYETVVQTYVQAIGEAAAQNSIELGSTENVENPEARTEEPQSPRGKR